jgi:hypothetical protein
MRLIFALFLALSIFMPSQVAGADGDTTLVSAHQQKDLTWYGSYKDWAVFPAASSNWHQIVMRYTMGCASGGCSDWDYTTVVDLLIPTGAMDSAVLRIDTISTSPLQIDTAWRVFQVKERLELAKVITPYGGALSQDWTRTFSFDVSDYYPLLHDSIEIDVRYQGWSSGFSATLEFMMIEGKPVRDVYKVENLYSGGFTYRTTAQFEGQLMPARALNLDPQAQQFSLRMAPSGHGFVNALNCAEFCNRDYYVYVDGQKVAEQAMWRNDCGLNGLWPQAGTWLYNRANWCPGDRVNSYRHDLSAYLIGADSIDIDIEAYTYTVPPGESPASYNMLAQLFHLGSFNQPLDVAIEDIITPTINDEHARFNPVCDEALISIRNKGQQDITSLTIAYGLSGNTNWRRFQWTGNLASLGYEEISLPMDSITDWSTLSGKLEFSVQIERVNGLATDDIDFNNRRSTPIKIPEQLPNPMRFELRTNNAASETWWKLEDVNGNVLQSGDNLTNSTTYRDTFDLSPGCYHLIIGDREKNGMSFPFNNDGSGRILLRNVGGNFFNKTFNPNFGTEISTYFTVGYSIGLEAPLDLNALWTVYPNPSKGRIKVQIDPIANSLTKLSLVDSQGRLLWSNTLKMERSKTLELDLPSGLQGFYFLELEQAGQKSRKSLVIQP